MRPLFFGSAKIERWRMLVFASRFSGMGKLLALFAFALAARSRATNPYGGLASPATKVMAPPAMPASKVMTPPTRRPTILPSRIPTRLPSRAPTLTPTRVPTLPSVAPTSPGAAPSPIGGNGIVYKGGQVLTRPTVYIIWYGTWNSSDTLVVELFIRSLSATPYNGILTTYFWVNGTQQEHVPNTIRFGGSIVDLYSRGTVLSEGLVHSIIVSAVGAGSLPYDSQGVYLVLSSGDVTMSGFCNGFCGWHSGITFPVGLAACAFIGLATACPIGCAPPRFYANSVNGQMIDGLINVISHEVCESISDPFGNGWNSREMGDQCEWQMGVISTNAAGKTYNVVLNGNPFFIQSEWVNAGGGYCALSYPA